MSETIQKLVDYIRNEIGYDGRLDHDADLLDEEILDSFSVVEIATYIQTNFEVELSGDDLVRENFSSLSSMAALITKRSESTS